ncbi:unnamed protein product [Caenorhabditis nigoni]
MLVGYVSLTDVPKWLIKRDCPNCSYCLVLDGTRSPSFCISGIEDIPAHVRCSFSDLMVESSTSLDVASSSILHLQSVLLILLCWITWLAWM